MLTARLLQRSVFAATAAVIAFGADSADAAEGSRFRSAVSSSKGVVASVHPEASEAGVAMLERGGNALDAAVATVFALGAARPDMCGIGGGGFLVYRSADGTVAALDFRETAPAAMAPESLQGGGMYNEGSGHKVAGVPGTVAGMAAALSAFGSVSWGEVLEGAIGLAARGATVSEEFSAFSGIHMRRFSPAARQLYLAGGLAPYPPGAKLVQYELAGDLELIASDGPSAFYAGPIADLIVASMEDSQADVIYSNLGGSGFLNHEDLAGYEAVWREPLQGKYRGHKIYSMPAPTSGGIAALQMLGLLKGFDVASFGQSSADHLHVLAEAQKIAFADRNAYVGDPDFVDVPQDWLLSKKYLKARRAEIDMERAQSYAAGERSSHTTHVSVIDAAGNAVSVTCSIEQPFGSGVVAPGTGFLLNNELTDFGAPGTANELQPGKRPRSSMAPAIVVKKGKPVLVTGAAGGPCIIGGVVQNVVNMVDFGLDVAQAIDAERVDATCFQGLTIEDTRIPLSVQVELENRGHELFRVGEYGTLLSGAVVESAGVDLLSGRRLAVSDPRSTWGAAAQ